MYLTSNMNICLCHYEITIVYKKKLPKVIVFVFNENRFLSSSSTLRSTLSICE